MSCASLQEKVFDLDLMFKELLTLLKPGESLRLSILVPEEAEVGNEEVVLPVVTVVDVKTTGIVSGGVNPALLLAKRI